MPVVRLDSVGPLEKAGFIESQLNPWLASSNLARTPLMSLDKIHRSFSQNSKTSTRSQLWQRDGETLSFERVANDLFKHHGTFINRIVRLNFSHGARKVKGIKRPFRISRIES